MRDSYKVSTLIIIGNIDSIIFLIKVLRVFFQQYAKIEKLLYCLFI